jgi:AraC-like DNA-binding protein
MQGVPLGFEHPADRADERAEYRPLPARGGAELYRARIVRHAFEPHAHAAYGIGVINTGAERFRYRGSEHLAGAGSLVLMNAHELHTGRAGHEGGWTYRMLYLEPALLGELAGSDAAHWHFADAVVHDATRAAHVNTLLATLWQPGLPLLVADETLAALVEAIRPLARVQGEGAAPASNRFDGVLELMQARLAEPLTLDELAAAAGLSPFHFLRSFRAAHHATPREMLMALRLLRAKQMLRAGVAAAEVAAAVGLADQAHLTRAFARRYGVTPGRYQQQSGTRPRRLVA